MWIGVTTKEFRVLPQPLSKDDDASSPEGRADDSAHDPLRSDLTLAHWLTLKIDLPQASVITDHLLGPNLKGSPTGAL